MMLLDFEDTIPRGAAHMVSAYGPLKQAETGRLRGGRRRSFISIYCLEKILHDAYHKSRAKNP